ncbi:hypothetical protein FRC04_011713 [Tulasnella sp. 424]|nr:hypothetical protein FRC04_011713 [Tulasnella sp. 424]KAG8978059.1 hypothetical protein FRC05_011174 [Tulasnella sp. 425]
MFKSILPSSKRSPSFDLVAPPPASEKENRPQHPLANVVNANDNVVNGRNSPKPPFVTHKKAESISTPSSMRKSGFPTVAGGGQLVEAGATNRAFEKMLDDMQIPSTLRPKLVTLDSPVKAAMLKSSQALNLMTTTPALAPPSAPALNGSLRKSRSIESMPSTPPRPRSGHVQSPSLDAGNLSTADLFAPPRPLSANFGTGSSFGSSSCDSMQSPISRTASVEFLPAMTDFSVEDKKAKLNKKDKKPKDKNEKDKIPEKELTAEYMSAWLARTKSSELEVDRLKRLRLLLRNETATWSENFLIGGGYSAMLTRLNDLLEMEWREEQHDDQALHELLRCFKALSTSSIGCFALRSACPTPFAQLVRLLYSDKKPGDIASRQLIVDLLLILYELYSGPKQPADDGAAGRGTNWEGKNSGHVIPPARPTVFSKPNAPPPPLPSPHSSIFALTRAILLTPKPAPSDSPSIPIDPHAFIAELHKPRIYKTYLQELSDVRRDYFWVFCHPTNTIWDLNHTDEEKVEKPRAPGGMTGGVEFEAMTYLTTHFRLINSLCRAAADLNLPSTDEQSAYKLHSDLFDSGLEKIILTARKSSTTYYPNLHLEIGRYVAHAIKAKYHLPYAVQRMIGLPPVPLVRRPPEPPRMPIANMSRPGSPVPDPRRSFHAAQAQAQGQARPPALPPRRMEELKF